VFLLVVLTDKIESKLEGKIVGQYKRLAAFHLLSCIKWK
jgi:hypothetical protein